MRQQLNLTLILLALLGALAIGCKKEATAPKVTTTEVASITQNTAKANGSVTDDGGADVTDMGMCWSTTPDPTISGDKTTQAGFVGNFESLLKGLTANTTYYIRAYATNSAGTGYGSALTFTTLAALLPEIKGAYPSNITQTTAQLGGEVISEGGAPTTRGVCWSTSENPTVADSKTTDGTGAGTFTSNLTGLSRSTTYYARAYATNIAGTVYGNAVVIRTMQGTVTDIDGNVYQTVLIGTQEWMAENLKVTHYRNGDAIPNITDNTQWANTTAGAWCSNNNDPANKNIYGLLYNFSTITDIRSACPAGWHVPDDTEWGILFNYLGGKEIAGYKMMPALKDAFNVIRGGDNSSGFTALLGGSRHLTGVFQFPGVVGDFWSSTITGKWKESNYVSISVGRKEIWSGYNYDNSGLSIRCIKDN